MAQKTFPHLERDVRLKSVTQQVYLRNVEAVRRRRCSERPRSTHQLFQEENDSLFEDIDEKQMRELTSSHTHRSLLMCIKACLFTLHSCYQNLILRNRGQSWQALRRTDKSRYEVSRRNGFPCYRIPGQISSSQRRLYGHRDIMLRDGGSYRLYISGTTRRGYWCKQRAQHYLSPANLQPRENRSKY